MVVIRHMKRTKKGRKLIYPWPEMKVGTVLGPFRVPDSGYLRSPAVQWSRINKNGRWQFRTEKVGNGQFTITRIK